MKSTKQIQHIVRYEWLMLALALTVLAACLGFQHGLGRLDLLMYDKAIQLNQQAARNDIIIVAIDDYSIAQLGKWPWPRARHAQLLEKINQAQPTSIGLDVIFSEPESGSDSNGDAEFAHAMSDNNRTVLPITLENNGAGLVITQPFPTLATAARALAHINLEVDPDGFTRSIFLREGRENAWVPHFSLALYNIIKKRAIDDYSDLPSTSNKQLNTSSPNSWLRNSQFYIPFYGNQGHFKSVPYVSVLRGEVPAQFFAGKNVLIGATAVGMSDAYPTPVSGVDGAMPGIEINANILASLLDGRSIIMASPELCAAYSVIPVLIALFAYLLLSPRLALSCTILLFPLTLVSSFLALKSGIWLPPSAALIVLIIAYPLWSWRRLEAAIRYLNIEISRLNQEPSLLPEPLQKTTPNKQTSLFTDALAQRISSMEIAAKRVRDLRQFVTDSLQSLPDATIVTSVEGHVILSNQPADAYFNSLGNKNLADALLPYLFSTMLSPRPLEQAATHTFSWWHLLDLSKRELMKNGIEVSDTLKRDLIIKSAPCTNANKEHIGWIVGIIDISTIRQAERARDETLRFISHDMRAPQASILALLELQQEPKSALPQPEFLERVAKAAQVTLGLADNFVQLARAETEYYRLEVVNTQDIVMDACDEMWSLAKTKQIQINTVVSDECANDEALININRSLMTRVLTNLLSNAIKYSPENTTVTISIDKKIEFLNNRVIIQIADQGYGITPTDQLKLFRRFQRFAGANQPKNEGVGLGLAFVKLVLERHQAHISLTSKPNHGTTFTLSIPAYSEIPS
ncbi:CHASE2 domain-containing protein [Solimicrobium silvestre]|uniref:histidine kinase n=1 Tax=Solimicrobium silvestre TaxID=2099400 RepID=A0A2S9H2M2_9BURK|nr:CHASE2 domain-containing protein [Solimicrobium silvestre]PRC94232.1 CHASE2 domain [Solimicrobium silvestre]